MKFHQRIFQLFLFLLPTQLALHLWPSFAFVNGIRVDYLSPTIYLTDVFFVVFIILWLIGIKFYLHRLKFIILNFQLLMTTIFILLNILFSLSPISSLLHWLRIGQVVLLYYYVVKNKLSLNTVLTPLLAGVIYTLFIAGLQMITGRNIGGLLYWLGERPLNISQPGIALFSLNGSLFLRPYATFPHPNALSGYAGLVFLLVFISKRKNLFTLVTLIASFVLVIFSFSQGTWVALGFSLVVNKMKNISVKFMSMKTLIFFVVILSLLLPIIFGRLSFNENTIPQSLLQRIDLSLTAGKIIAHYPLLGVGLGQFTREIPHFSSQAIWWLQPVHNIFLLIATEVGLVCLALFTILVVNKLSTISNYKLLIFVAFILVTGLVDHYWLTAHQTLLLMPVVFGTIKNDGLIHKQ